MKHSKLKNNNQSSKTLGQKIVEKAEAKIKEAHSRGVAVFCSGKSVLDSKPSLTMDF